MLLLDELLTLSAKAAVGVNFVLLNLGEPDSGDIKAVLKRPF